MGTRYDGYMNSFDLRDENRTILIDTVENMLSSCPALHVLDFTATDCIPFSDLEAHVDQNIGGAGRVTHIFASRQHHRRIRSMLIQITV